MDFIEISLRLVFAFVLVLIFFQFSGGKRQFSQMTTFDLISNFILSAILGGYVYSHQTTWFGFVFIIAVYFIINYIINFLTHKTDWGRAMIIGTPIIIIQDGEINRKNLKKMNMDMKDFMSLLRTKEIHSLKEVELAQIEVGGDLTVVRYGEEDYAVMLIENGKISQESLKRIKKSEKWLQEQLKKQKIKSAQDVFYAQWQKKELYIVKFK